MEGFVAIEIVMITHNEEIAQLSDRIVRIEDRSICKPSSETIQME